MTIATEPISLKNGRKGLLNYDLLFDGRTWSLNTEDFGGLPMQVVRDRIRFTASKRRVSVVTQRSLDGEGLLVKAIAWRAAK